MDFHCPLFPKLTGEVWTIVNQKCKSRVTIFAILNFNNPTRKNFAKTKSNNGRSSKKQLFCNRAKTFRKTFERVYSWCWPIAKNEFVQMHFSRILIRFPENLLVVKKLENNWIIAVSGYFCVLSRLVFSRVLDLHGNLGIFIFPPIRLFPISLFAYMLR